MKRIILLLLIAVQLHAQPGTRYNVADKSSGQSWSPAEHNMMSKALNSIPVIDIDMFTQYGIVCDGVSDMATKLMQFNSDWRPYKVKIRAHFRYGSGVLLTSNGRWGYNIYDIDVIADGGNIEGKCIYAGTDEKLARFWWNGEINQKNVLQYIGTQTFTSSYKRLNPGKAGDTIVYLKTAADTSLYRPGHRVLLQSFDQIGNGFPLGTRYNEWNTVVSNNKGSGSIVLQKSLEFNHDTAVYDVPDAVGTGNPSGKFRMTDLDRDSSGTGTDLRYPAHVGFYNFTFGLPYGGATGISGTFQPIGDDVLAVGCYFMGHFWPSQTRNMLIIGGAVLAGSNFSSEFDKQVYSFRAEGVTFNNVVSNGTGINNIYLKDCTFKESVQLCGQNITIDHCACRANSYPDVFAGAIDGAPASLPIINYRIINGTTFSRTAANQAGYAINIAAMKSINIPSVTGTTIMIPFGTPTDANALKYYTITKGTYMFKSNGSKMGVVDSVYFDQTQYSGAGAWMVAGNWPAPVANELWRWSPVLNFFDDGTNKVVSQYSPAFSKYGGELLMRANKEGNGGRQTIKLGLGDLRIDGNDFGASFGGWLTNINVNVLTPYKPGDSKMVLNITDTAYGNIATIDLMQYGERTLTRFGKQGLLGNDAFDSLQMNKFHRQLRFFISGSSGPVSDQTKKQLGDVEVILTYRKPHEQ